MKSGIRYVVLGVGIVSACAASFAVGLRANEAQESIEGGLFESSPGGATLEVLFHGEGRDVPVDVGILTFPPGTNSGDHQHPQTEIFFVLEGILEHVVDGESQILEPGMLGFVKPPSFVNHITPAGGGPTRTLVMWAPAGNAASLASRWQRIERDDD